MSKIQPRIGSLAAVIGQLSTNSRDRRAEPQLALKKMIQKNLKVSAT